MFHLISVLKNLSIALVIVLILQVKVDQSTLEDKAVMWFQASPLTAPIQQVAEGGARLLRDTINKITNMVDVNLFDKIANRPGARDLGVSLQRSKQYLQEKAERATQKIEQELQSQEDGESSQQ